MSHISFNRYIYDLINLSAEYCSKDDVHIQRMRRNLNLIIKADISAPYKYSEEYIEHLRPYIIRCDFINGHKALSTLIVIETELKVIYGSLIDLYDELTLDDRKMVDTTLIKMLALYD